MQLQDWERIISTIGVPVALLIAIGLTVRSLAKWCKPHVERVVSSHVQLLTTCDTTLKSQAQQLVELKEHTIDPRGPCQRTASALAHASRGLEFVAQDSAAKKHFEEMRKALED